MLLFLGVSRERVYNTLIRKLSDIGVSSMIIIVLRSVPVTSLCTSAFSFVPFPVLLRECVCFIVLSVFSGIDVFKLNVLAWQCSHSNLVQQVIGKTNVLPV